VKEHGATPIRYLDRLGVLGPRMIGVHCVWLDDEEIALMGARGAALSYCPSSNMFLGDGITRIPEMLRAGVRIGLGTDGGCTNNRHSVLEEMRMTSLLQRVRLLDGTALSAERAFAMGTRDGAGILGLEAGTIAPGQLADLVAVDLDDPSLHPPTDLLKSVVYAMSSRAVTDVWVHGRQVVSAGRLCTVDQTALMARVREVTRGWSL
jgi:5-methylthioadenosine/S-adenosylhomocysteine deaminase